MGLIEQVGEMLMLGLSMRHWNLVQLSWKPPHGNNFLLQHEATARFPNVVTLSRFLKT